jgi:hypothetical protein
LIVNERVRGKGFGVEIFGAGAVGNRIHVLTKSRTDGLEYRTREVRIATVIIATWIMRTVIKPTPCRRRLQVLVLPKP